LLVILLVAFVGCRQHRRKAQKTHDAETASAAHAQYDSAASLRDSQSQRVVSHYRELDFVPAPDRGGDTLSTARSGAGSSVDADYAILNLHRSESSSASNASIARFT
jgi:hypothetical protein